ncbi:MAG: NAD-dependent dehydratase [Acidobacteria bacterium]|nr:MAG: NAD-dependent dehydratase [Acidobacteriota bacterium]
MKVLVTGGNGFVGAHLVRELLANGEEVVCLLRKTSRADNLKGLPIQTAYGDVKDLSSIRESMRNCFGVYHCAADYRLWCKTPAEMYATNVEGTRNVLQAAFEQGVKRVVYTSTVGCLGLTYNGKAADETTPVSFSEMIGDYKKSKFLAEREAEAWSQKGLAIVIVNPSTPIGDLDLKPTPTGKMIVDFLKGKMFGYVETGMNLIDVNDVARGHIAAMKSGKVGEKYILGNRNLTLKAIFDLLSKVSGVRSPDKQVPHWVAETYARVENFWSIGLRRQEPEVPLEAVKLSRHKMWFDSSKAVRELNLPQSPVDAALQRASLWFQEHGYV